ncbi:hypothetical protein FOC1_g10006508 [Fusarium oxysporum f. sp. cubense race 1]|uniref:Uncharacterized protein n=1 Tax=Fusarium oxysporum f. sp. cubense (strain race 1) TaxID=1229664 RepID=N4UTL2_FUSC1|nr:hypothetical protein FOC1_g10006508 [Fusarium oxysporum f. sp. cubense race 1]
MQELPPGISEADFNYISEINGSLMEKYEKLLDRTPHMKATCVKQLYDKASDQKVRIKVHMALVERWFTATKKTQQSEGSTGENSIEDLKHRLANIRDKLQDAISSFSRVPTQSRGRSSERKIRNSRIFKDLDQLIEKIGFDVSAIESLVYRLSNFQEQEPLCINPNDVAITGHHVAIESNFNKGDYIWFEAHSRLVLPGDESDAVYSEPSSPLVTVMNGLRQRWRRDSGYSSSTALSSNQRIQTPQNVAEFCRVQDIKFYPIESEKMPFLRAAMFDHGSTRPKRFMYHLGHVLLELGLWKELKGQIIQQQLDKELSRLGTETSVQYQEAVRYCMAYGESSDDEQSDYEMFQRNFYQSVISPLREMVKRGEMNDMECQEITD